MDSRQLLQFLPTMEMICEAFEPKGLDCRFVISDKNLHYRGPTKISTTGECGSTTRGRVYKGI